MRPPIEKIKTHSMSTIVFHAHEHGKTRHFVSGKIGGNEKLETIMEAVCEVFGITTRQIRSASRETEFVIPRHIYVYLCYLFTTARLREIGHSLNGRDHTTVINSRKQVFDWLDARDDKFFAYWSLWLKKAPKHLIP